METISIISIITIAFLGSFGHCIGMCGPIAVSIPFSGQKKVLGISLYNIGRVVTYSFLGLVLSVFGNVIPLGAIQRPLSISIGIVLLLFVILPKLKTKTFLGKHYLKFNNWVIGKMRNNLSTKSPLSRLIFGLLNGLLPCGMVFIALSFALLSPSAPLYMLFFGLGTIPSMFLLPFLANFKPTWRLKITQFVPYMMIFFGLIFILRGMSLGVPYLSPKYSESNTEVNSCCHRPLESTLNKE
mgnify:CR=1 FL=1